MPRGIEGGNEAASARTGWAAITEAAIGKPERERGESGSITSFAEVSRISVLGCSFGFT